MFVFQDIGNVFGNTPTVSGSITFTINGGTAQTFTRFFSGVANGSIASGDVVLAGAQPGVAVGNTVVLAAGTLTTTGNFAGAPPATRATPDRVSPCSDFRGDTAATRVFFGCRPGRSQVSVDARGFRPLRGRNIRSLRRGQTRPWRARDDKIFTNSPLPTAELSWNMRSSRHIRGELSSPPASIPTPTPMSPRPISSTQRKPSTRVYGFAALAVASFLGWAGAADATVITFDNGAVVAGSTLSNQYAAQGVTFAGGGGQYQGVVNPNSDFGFATNTDLTISQFSTAQGEGAPLSGLVLRSRAGFNLENGNPVFTMTFSSPVATLSLDFGDVSTDYQYAPAIFALQPNNNAVLIALEPGSQNGTSTAVGIPTGVTRIIVVPGAEDNFVAVDNLNFTFAAGVPEPTSVAASLVGLGLLGVVCKRRQRRLVAN